jgi:hypothetical protein
MTCSSWNKRVYFLKIIRREMNSFRIWSIILSQHKPLTLVAIHVLPFGIHHKLTHILSQIRPQKSRFAFSNEWASYTCTDIQAWLPCQKATSNMWSKTSCIKGSGSVGCCSWRAYHNWCQEHTAFPIPNTFPLSVMLNRQEIEASNIQESGT